MHDDVGSTGAARIDTAGLVMLPIRLVIGWTYFSAFWRRVALADKLNPDLPGYIGEKFNHFLPQAIGIGPVIDHLLTHPGLLRAAMIAFTVVEGIVGLCVMLGLFTRVMGAGVLGLAFGILISAGGLGTTCLDEWQIGALGVACGLALVLSGGGRYSLDRGLAGRGRWPWRLGWSRWIASGPVDVAPGRVLGSAVVVFALTLATNQHFHGGVYGTLHNTSIAPQIEISDIYLTAGVLRFDVYRTEGVDVYGSFLIGVRLIDETTGVTVINLDGGQLSRLPPSAIANRYIAEVVAGKHSLVIPLGARATITLPTGGLVNHDHQYRLTLTDVSGVTWTVTIKPGG